MSDNRSRFRGHERTRINVSQDLDLRDWSNKFGVTHDELKDAVRAVGTSAEAVESYLVCRSHPDHGPF